MATYSDFLRDVIRARFGHTRCQWGKPLWRTEREIQVIVDPDKMALYKMTVPELVSDFELKAPLSPAVTLTRVKDATLSEPTVS